MPFGLEDRWRNGRNLFTISFRHKKDFVAFEMEEKVGDDVDDSDEDDVQEQLGYY